LGLDALKGFVPVLLAVHLGPRYGLGEGTVALVALAAFLGHLYPVFFHFRGGKGVATAAGTLFGIDPLLGAATLATWLIIAAFFRYSSLASIVAAVFAPFWQLLTDGSGPVAVRAHRDGAAPSLAARGEHQAAVRRHRESARRQGRSRRDAGGEEGPARCAALNGRVRDRSGAASS
jgi:glycerol-3-phosphate acyltransferase PlsY